MDRAQAKGAAGGRILAASQLTAVSDPVQIPTEQGVFLVQGFGFADGSEHLSLTSPVLADQMQEAPAVRLHSECATGDIFGSYRCDCGPQLTRGLEMIARDGGVLLYLRNQEGRGIGLVNKLRAYALQDEGADTLDANLALGLPADARDYTQAAIILRELGINRVRLISNNPAKAQALTDLGIEVTELIPDEVPPRPENLRYLLTKRDRMGHRLTLKTGRVDTGK